MTPCHGLTMETLQAIAEGGDIESLILEIGDYEGPTALLVDAAAWLTGRKEWRKAFRQSWTRRGGKMVRMARARPPNKFCGGRGRKRPRCC